MPRNLIVIILSILRIISSFLVLIILSRYLDKSTFGLFNYFVAFSTVSLTILFNGFTPIYLRNSIINKKNNENKFNLYDQIFFFFILLLILFNIIFQITTAIKDIAIEIKLLNIFLLSGFFHHIVLQEVRSQKKYINLSLILFLERFLFLLFVILIYLGKININIIFCYIIFYLVFTFFILILTKNFKKFVLLKFNFKIFDNFSILFFSYLKNTLSILTNNLSNQSFLIFIVGLMYSFIKSAEIAITAQLLSIIVFTVVWVELIIPVKYMELKKNNNINEFKFFFKNKIVNYFLIIIFFSTIYIEVLVRTNIIEILFTTKYKASIFEISILSVVTISQCFEIFISWYLLSFKLESHLLKISCIKLICFFIFLLFKNYELLLFGFALSFVLYFTIGLAYMINSIKIEDFFKIIYFYFLFIFYNISNYLFNYSYSIILFLILIISCLLYIIINFKLYYTELKNFLYPDGNN